MAVTTKTCNHNKVQTLSENRKRKSEELNMSRSTDILT